MILGCGVDLIEVGRFEQEVARRDGGLVEELFSAGELAWCRRRRRACEGYAMAYAAKEALFKALGTGKVGRMAWSDIAIAWPAGAVRPAMALSGETAAAAQRMGVAGVSLALAVTKTLAAAMVIVEGERREAGGETRSHPSPVPSRLQSEDVRCHSTTKRSDGN